MELQGILGGGRNFWKIGRADCRNGRVATIGTMTQWVLNMTETNSQCSSLSLQLLIVFLERVVILSQLVNVEAMVIQTIVKILLLTIMHQHYLPYIPSKVTNQLLERVGFLFKAASCLTLYSANLVFNAWSSCSVFKFWKKRVRKLPQMDTSPPLPEGCFH